ncbi:TMEM175 family protein [uncultured Chryseobacterium sp.]|uniref:TMEM175 family protein n=1 Tax=uncultured Chryseobacterium sp. TaxID=259322 RepID=UPI0025F8DDB7|nr:TMEM175 family protein [uncultured Chryseobacterium sp.]
MKLTYNKLAGQSAERINAISDAVFGVAMTLLVLEIKVPELEGPETEGELMHAFVALLPKFLVYFLSFMTAGIFWVGQSAQFRHIEKSDRNLIWINLLFLLFVSTLPFSTAFLGDHITFKFSIFLYWLNIFLMGLFLYINWMYADKKGFITEESRGMVYEPIKRRIMIAQALYFIGAMLCFVSPYLSIGVIIAIQLNYAFAFFSGNEKK